LRELEIALYELDYVSNVVLASTPTRETPRKLHCALVAQSSLARLAETNCRQISVVEAVHSAA